MLRTAKSQRNKRRVVHFAPLHEDDEDKLKWLIVKQIPYKDEVRAFLILIFISWQLTYFLLNTLSCITIKYVLGTRESKIKCIKQVEIQWD